MLTDLLPAWPYITLARTASRRAGYLSLTSPLLWLSQPCHSLARLSKAASIPQPSDYKYTSARSTPYPTRLGRTTASRCSPYDPLSTLSRPSFLLPIPAVRWPSSEIASARGRFHFLFHHRCLGASSALAFCLLGSAPGPSVPCSESCLSIVACLWLCHFALLRRRFLILARHSTVFRRFFCRDPTTTTTSPSFT